MGLCFRIQSNNIRVEIGPKDRGEIYGPKEEKNCSNTCVSSKRR